MPIMIGKRRGTYRNRGFRVGEEFEASRGDAKVLAAIGQADYQEPKPPVVAGQEPLGVRTRTYKRRDMVSEQPPVEVYLPGEKALEQAPAAAQTFEQSFEQSPAAERSTGERGKE